jgi:hypothetical protein
MTRWILWSSVYVFDFTKQKFILERCPQALSLSSEVFLGLLRSDAQGPRLCHGLRAMAHGRLRRRQAQSSDQSEHRVRASIDDRDSQLRTIIHRSLLLAFVAAGVGCTTPTLEDQRSLTKEDKGAEAMEASGPPKRVILITVGGLESSDFLNAFGHAAGTLDRVRMPNLARMGREGVVGIQARPPSPSSSYASHATLATGLLPTRHGVIADYTLDREGNRTLPFWDSRLLKGTSLWDAAIARGVLALGWPTTVGARIELVIPDGRAGDADTSWLEFIDQRASPRLLRELQTMAALATEDEEREAVPWPTPAEKDAAFVELACRIAASERDPGLWLIRLNQTVSFQRSAGFGSVEVDAALARIDVEIGRLMDCLAATGRLTDTAVFVTGDVAYRAVHTQIDPNVVLVRQGLVGRDPRSTIGVRSWLALVRSNGRSAYVYARDAESALEARKWLEAEAAKTGAFEIVPASDLATSGGDPQAWFGLAAHSGFAFGNGLTKPILRPSEIRGSAGAFPFRDPETTGVGLVAWGRGIRPRVRVPDLNLSDVAPTIAKLLGLRLDSELDGEAIVGILRAAVPVKPLPGPKRLGLGTDGDVDRALRELGGGHEIGRDE